MTRLLRAVRDWLGDRLDTQGPACWINDVSPCGDRLGIWDATCARPEGHGDYHATANDGLVWLDPYTDQEDS